MVSESEERSKKRTKNVRLDAELVGKLNYIISVDGGDHATFLDRFVRGPINTRFDELTAAGRGKGKK